MLTTEFSFVTPIMIKGNKQTGGNFGGWGVKTGEYCTPGVTGVRDSPFQPSSLVVSEESYPSSDGSSSLRRLDVRQQRLMKCSRSVSLYESSRDT